MMVDMLGTVRRWQSGLAFKQQGQLKTASAYPVHEAITRSIKEAECLLSLYMHLQLPQASADGDNF